PWLRSIVVYALCLCFFDATHPLLPLPMVSDNGDGKQLFDKVTNNFKVTRAFVTMVEEMKVIEAKTPRKGNSKDTFTEVMAVVAYSDRIPMLLFMGGGMGVGKTTVLKEVLKEGFWAEAAPNVVVVEADTFKETNVIYRDLSSKGHHNDMLQAAELDVIRFLMHPNQLAFVLN
ncbi:putative zeta toxin domain, P-loop containing nucleoside triphosphate hydrolase, partial [Tanacetum coccineum]